MKFSVIAPAYKVKNVNVMLRRLLNQDLDGFVLEKIVVVALGYPRNYHFLEDKKIEVVRENIRRGKAHSINLGLKRINSGIVIVESADTLPRKYTMQKLLEPFISPDVGMTTGKVVPLNKKDNFLGFFIHLIWFLHNIVSSYSVKVGEIMAFRKIFKKIPDILATDESYIESVFYKKGYKIVYVPSAVINNRGIEDLSFILNQRRRYFAGHLHIKREYNYSVSTMSIRRVFAALLKYFEIKSIENIREIVWLIAAVFIELFARFLGTMDFYLLKKIPYKWDVFFDEEPVTG